MYALSLLERAMEPVGKVLVHQFYNRVPRNRGPCGQLGHLVFYLVLRTTLGNDWKD